MGKVYLETRSEQLRPVPTEDRTHPVLPTDKPGKQRRTRMSLYNVLHGQQPNSAVLLAILGNPEVGRFRDAWSEIVDGVPRIAVYTRNGGGNRECCCDDSYSQARELCSQSPRVVERTWARSYAEAQGAEILEVVGTYPNGQDMVRGRLELPMCEVPNSIECGCTGCIIEYRLPAHPLYLSDSDDDFDCTYATVYFRVPDEFLESVSAVSVDGEVDTDARWEAAIAALDT